MPLNPKRLNIWERADLLLRGGKRGRPDPIPLPHYWEDRLPYSDEDREIHGPWSTRSRNTRPDFKVQVLAPVNRVLGRKKPPDREVRDVDRFAGEQSLEGVSLATINSSYSSQTLGVSVDRVSLQGYS